jgi:hypothetical protein
LIVPFLVLHSVCSAAKPASEMAARAAIMRLIAAKDELEAQIAALISSLPECVRVPARNDLLDDEGFPRADIDVYQVCMPV